MNDNLLKNTIPIDSWPSLEAELARRSLLAYVCQAWPIVEPETPFVSNWHIGLLCEYLEAVTRLQITNLIINIPPRHMKSLLVSVFWPTWTWTHSPHIRWLTGSYAASLAVRDSLKSRRIIQSSWYRQRFGSVFRLTGDQNLKNRYENDKTGTRLAFSFESAVTGEGADILIVDDPLKAQDAFSAAMRTRVNDIYDTTLTTRANDARTARRVIIMQRLHQDDLTGHLLEKMKEEGARQYELVCLPTEYDGRRFFSSIGREDMRATPGDLLWPARFGPAENASARVELGLLGYAGQHSQRPVPAGGGIFERAWWQTHNRFNLQTSHPYGQVIGRWLSWDTAFKDSEQNDSSAFTVWELLADYHLRLRHAHWQKLRFPQLARAIEDEARRWMSDGKLRGIIIEDKASGISALQTLEQSAPAAIAALLRPFQPGAVSKIGRARQASLWCERGCVLMPEPSQTFSWLLDFEEMLFNFPAAKTCDAVDSMTQAILFLEYLLSEGWTARLPRE